MRDQIISEFLKKLAARVPAPGGGTTAALHAAQAASLVGMAARYSDGAEYAGHREVIDDVLAESDALWMHALRVSEKDACAFNAVGAAYALPETTAEERDARSSAVAAALAAACRPPAEVIEAAADVLTLVERLLPVGNRRVVADLAAAALAARAAAATARVQIEVNLDGVPDERVRAEFFAIADAVDLLCERADMITVAIRTGSGGVHIGR
ncbi:cyclodeaminase/cyclohydrolase family protein [Amycolatopsis nigrescens]|uniref:cyclodeaminase/cyclohydrolase family protein n=1 Tax=Amycolatopsis nigrescens TaxID=381445 RepID=UPI00035C9C17|nr:cyclodeaminase/cyclohydrolase family protein [Amycolatopsis nigrescens]